MKGEGLRLLRTDSSQKTFVENIRIFKLRLRARGYPNNLVYKTLSEVKFPDRKKALQENIRVHKEILPFVTQYNPSVPNLKHILMDKHIICSQIKFYATIEPCIYIMISPIARGEVGGLVPRLMF